MMLVARRVAHMMCQRTPRRKASMRCCEMLYYVAACRTAALRDAVLSCTRLHNALALGLLKVDDELRVVREQRVRALQARARV